MPIPGSVQGHVLWDFMSTGSVEGVHGRGFGMG